MLSRNRDTINLDRIHLFHLRVFGRADDLTYLREFV